ncbi:hypothetical protein PVK06_026505 [Gossypium arboreum]|uniref:Uncharacterized protein n=1 Tax=Gossypium arboreum TaxID=29729 RepID=A0ABR0NXV1_GOSAR|nr:hypothetical protein PVK06_026505 [Gossypium arboreum]
MSLNGFRDPSFTTCVGLSYGDTFISGNVCSIVANEAALSLATVVDSMTAVGPLFHVCPRTLVSADYMAAASCGAIGCFKDEVIGSVQQTTMVTVESWDYRCQRGEESCGTTLTNGI